MDRTRINQARAALERRDWPSAEALFRTAPAEPADPQVALDHALCLRMMGRLPEALQQVEAALVMEPRHFLALITKGTLLERLGRSKAAVVAYGNAVATAPPAERLPPPLLTQLDHARTAVRAHAEALAEHLEHAVAPLRERFAGESLGRFDESLRIFAGLQKPYLQEPLLLHFPRLPAIPFYDRAMFPWLETLEAATPMIQGELLAVLARQPEGFAPYIDFPPGTPVNQWGELNHSTRWSSFFLWRDGVRQDRACELCPQTAALVEELPLMRQAGFAPTVIFSQLEARTRIPPHTGSANHRLLAHLPLIVPGPAFFRVGAETRRFEAGRAWVFDDTIEHEARNDADEPRVIMIIDLWNPSLSMAERELVSAMMTASNAFRAEG
ncbi:MAG TPA: aspartyl/asparaginyl beta-hydroxylase domain-containing protein [Caulobacteraceae bacterium]|nr:aspartyl/asparaginyl beta-hydroxylase domain-containing protein [Caulobacteraceae bacterium]